MKPVCFLSMNDLEGFVADDALSIRHLNDQGIEVKTLSWRQTDVDWDSFEMAIIRTTWDYQKEPEKFLSVLRSIDRSSARLENPLEIVEWNVNKRYLGDMKERGCPIVPTIWDTKYERSLFQQWQQTFDVDELIIKPTVSATANHTYRLKEYDPQLEAVFAYREFMVQPFIDNIVSEGEYSLIYFNGQFSHAINKRPKPRDFRVQEDHGGTISSIVPDEQLLKAGTRAIEAIDRNLLYSRVDLVRDNTCDWLLMEMELIEPALYLRMDEHSPQNFCNAIVERLGIN